MKYLSREITITFLVKDFKDKNSQSGDGSESVSRRTEETICLLENAFY